MSPWNTSVLAFEDARQTLDRALEAERGLKVTCASRGEAITLRARFNYFRIQDRRANGITYPIGHPLHNNSNYDKLSLRIPPKGEPEDSTIFIEKRSSARFSIEEII